LVKPSDTNHGVGKKNGRFKASALHKRGLEKYGRKQVRESSANATHKRGMPPVLEKPQTNRGKTEGILSTPCIFKGTEKKRGGRKKKGGPGRHLVRRSVRH